MKSLLENSNHGYSLRGKELSSIPRFNSRFIKDSLRYKGSVLWNIVLYHEQHKRFSSFFDLRKHVVNRDYFKDFNSNALSASTTRHRHSAGPAQQDFDWGGLNVSQLFFFRGGGGGGPVACYPWKIWVLVTLSYRKVVLNCFYNLKQH